MDVTRTKLPDVALITPKVFADARGFFLETFNLRRYTESGLPLQFVQDNHSRSKVNVLRGLHYQLERPQGKLVSVVRGKIFDIAVDIRRGSPTFAQWFGVTLDDVKRQALWIPPGFAHGFCALSEVADVVYKCTEYYDPPSEKGIRWDDPLIGISWPIAEPLVSDKDRNYAPLKPDSHDLPLYSR